MLITSYLAGLVAVIVVLLGLAFPVLGTVHKLEDAPYPGMSDGAIESLDGIVQISDGSTTGTVSFTPTAFDNAPRAVTGYELESQSGSSSTTQVERAEITTRTASSVEVEVELDTAPGAGDSTTIRVDVALFGS